MTRLGPRRQSAALGGTLFALPFVVLNAMVAGRVEPFFSLIGPGLDTSLDEYVLLVALLLMLAGAFVAYRPLLVPGTDRKRPVYIANTLVAALLSIVSLSILIAFASDVYVCGVLATSSCD